MKDAKKSNNQSICQELGGLLAQTQALLECPEPTFAAWEEYSNRRNELFDRLATLPTLFPDGEENSGEIQDLVALAFEKDRLLLQKIEHCLSNLRQEIATAAEKRRVAEVYANHAAGARALSRNRF
jgi:hypothetical protein